MQKMVQRTIVPKYNVKTRKNSDNSDYLVNLKVAYFEIAFKKMKPSPITIKITIIS